MGLPKPLNLYIQKLIMKVDTPISSVPFMLPGMQTGQVRVYFLYHFS